MSKNPSIHLDEFTRFTTLNEEKDNYDVTSMDHPEFGRWDQKTMDLGFVKITEHKARLSREINVEIDDDSLMQNVHHCMCVGGSMSTHFSDQGFVAGLQPGGYHYLTVLANNYSLDMSEQFHNVHIQFSREYYTDLLSDAERWSSSLKEKINTSEVCYPGSYSLTPAMTRNVYDIFTSPLSGSLKKLMIEAKILELIALQWDKALSSTKRVRRGTPDIIQEIHIYLTNNFLDDHSLKSICLRFGINEFALKHGFRETFKTSVFEYLLSCRLEYAKDLLQNTGSTIQEIASKVGYKYPNHFSTAFKNKFGISPGSLANRR